MKIYLGNFPFSITTENEVRELFAPWCKLNEVIFPVFDNGTRRSFIFAESEGDDADAMKAILALDQSDLKGRIISVSKRIEKSKKNHKRNNI